MDMIYGPILVAVSSPAVYLPEVSSEKVNRLLDWDSLWMNWAMLSVSPCPWPRGPIMEVKTPRTIPVKNSESTATPGGLGPVPGGAGPWGPEGGGGAENTGWEAWTERYRG